jgi:hypothetical protein
MDAALILRFGLSIHESFKLEKQFANNYWSTKAGRTKLWRLNEEISVICPTLMDILRPLYGCGTGISGETVSHRIRSKWRF